MTGQTKRASATEALAGTAIGFCVSWAATPPILALFGYQAGAGTAFGITVVYTVLSVVRGYLVRRLFNHLQHRPEPDPFREASERGQIKRIGSNGLPPCPKPPPPPSPPRRRKWRDRW